MILYHIYIILYYVHLLSITYKYNTTQTPPPPKKKVQVEHIIASRVPAVSRNKSASLAPCWLA